MYRAGCGCWISKELTEKIAPAHSAKKLTALAAAGAGNVFSLCGGRTAGTAVSAGGFVFLVPESPEVIRKRLAQAEEDPVLVRVASGNWVCGSRAAAVIPAECAAGRTVLSGTLLPCGPRKLTKSAVLLSDGYAVRSGFTAPCTAGHVPAKRGQADDGGGVRE